MRPHFIHAFLRQGHWGGISVAAKVAGSLAMNKILAMAFGVAGIAWHAQLLNIFNLLILLPNEGFGRGAAILGQKGHHVAKWAWLLSGGTVLLLLLGFMALPAHFTGLPLEAAGRLALGVCVLLYTAHLLLLAQMHAAGRLQQYALLGAVGNVLGALLMVAFWYWGPKNHLYLLLMLPLGLAMSLLFSGKYAFKYGPFLENVGLKAVDFQKLMPYALPALGALLFEQALPYAVRSHSIWVFGTVETGAWQAGNTVASYYTALFIAGPAAVVYPQLLQLHAAQDQAFQYLKQAASWIVPGTWLGLLLLFLVREEVLRLLFGPGLPAISAQAFGLQLLADALRLPGFLLGYWLLVQGRAAWLLGAQAAVACGYLASAFFLVGKWGAVGYAAAQVCGALLGVLCMGSAMVWRERAFR